MRQKEPRGNQRKPQGSPERSALGLLQAPWHVYLPPSQRIPARSCLSESSQLSPHTGTLFLLLSPQIQNSKPGQYLRLKG